ncbi:MAG TPA: hypothetical protein VHC20_00590 [Candidatus Paceibacterota bacterium]|nr:hypothetical protein [Candidatus Paceibacterota bacterium]
MRPQLNSGTLGGRRMLSVLEQHLVYREMELLSDADLVRWARAIIREDDAASSDPDILELSALRLDSPGLGDALRLLRAAVTRASPNFDIRGPGAQAFGRAAFVQTCRRFLAENLPPYQLCRLVSPIEQTFDYPAWLGDFYNQCDWCEPDSTRSQFGHLAEYVAQFIAENADLPS